MNTGEAARRLIARALELPDVRNALATYAKELLVGEKQFRELHWGRADEAFVSEQLPGRRNPHGLVRLGALSRIAYVTAKGDDEDVEWVHTFSNPFPWLCVATRPETKRRDLVIVRGRSSYDVTKHGIID